MISNNKEIKKVLLITLVLNLIVSFGKIYYGYLTNTISMISDGYHSLMDGTSNIIALFAIYLSSKPPDENYPYGYKKIEVFASLIISLLLFATSYNILSNLFERIFYKNSIPHPNIDNIVIMITTIFINIFVTSYETKKGKELKSKILIDDSSHTLSDIFVSITVLVGIIAIRYGLYFVDILTSFIIVLIIAKIAWKILQESLEILSDSAVINNKEIEIIVNSVNGVKSCHKIRTRGLKNYIFIDLHIQVDSNISIKDAHKIGHEVQKILKEKIEGVNEVITHVEPL
ncbi:MAG: cation transporter [Candidatus Sericytochromatia bacterium]|nr:MAG: cation transporter [Candidatus Sericytochromatia bacterium]